MAFTDQVVFGSGVTFNGPVTFNADSFTVNANIVSIDDYNIVLGDTAAASDENISTAGGGGLLLRRGSGNTAEWLWTPTSLHGITGIWTGDGHIGFKGNTGGLRPNAGGNLLVHGTGIRIDGGATTEHGLIMSFAGSGTTTGRTIEMSRYSPAGTTAFIEVNLPSTNPSRPFVAIKDGANKKTVRQINHTHIVGTPVRIDPTNGNYVAAQGNNAVNAEVVGIVSKVIDGNNFELTFLGEVYDLNWSAITTDGAARGITGAVYYLSTDVAGKVIPSAPTLTNTVHKAVFVANTSSSVIVIPWTGGVLSDSVVLADSTSNTVTINQINQFKPGDVIRFRAVSGGITLEYGSGFGYTASRYAYGAYVRADAKDSQNADSVAGMVVSTIPFEAPFSGINQSFNLMMDGFFSASGITAINSGTPGSLVAGRNYYLSVNSAGTTGAFEGATASLTDSRPTGLNTVDKPVMFATSPTTGYVYSYRGAVVAPLTDTNVPMGSLLIQDLRASQNGNLVFSVYDGGSAPGRQVMVFDNTVKGNIRIGPSTFISNSVGAGSTLSVQGTIVSGDAEAVAGSVILASRYSAPYPNTLNVFGSMNSTGNSVLSYGVRPKAGSVDTFESTDGNNLARTAVEVGVDNSNPLLRLSGLTQRTATRGSNLTLPELFKVSGFTATFAGFVSAAAGVSGPTFYGNATTASALRTSRTIALGGDVTATGVAFDGSGNINLTTAIAAASIVNADIADLTITDAKLATISTANKINNSATTATSANTASAIVARDVNGDFTARLVSSTTTPSGPEHLTRKDYVDGRGTVILSNYTQVYNDTAINSSTPSVSTTRRSIELHPTVPETAKYVVISVHTYGGYFVNMGSSTTLNSGHRFNNGSPGLTPIISTTVLTLPIDKINSTSRRIYFNTQTQPALSSTPFTVDVNGYIV
jgi:hypothetical protein